MTAPFRAFVVDQTADGFTMGIQQLEQRDLPPGDVLIQVAYAWERGSRSSAGVAYSHKPDTG